MDALTFPRECDADGCTTVCDSMAKYKQHLKNMVKSRTKEPIRSAHLQVKTELGYVGIPGRGGRVAKTDADGNVCAETLKTRARRAKERLEKSAKALDDACSAICGDSAAAVDSMNMDVDTAISFLADKVQDSPTAGQEVKSRETPEYEQRYNKTLEAVVSLHKDYSTKEKEAHSANIARIMSQRKTIAASPWTPLPLTPHDTSAPVLASIHEPPSSAVAVDELRQGIDFVSESFERSVNQSKRACFKATAAMASIAERQDDIYTHQNSETGWAVVNLLRRKYFNE